MNTPSVEDVASVILDAWTSGYDGMQAAPEVRAATAVMALFSPAPVVTADELWDAHLPTVVPYPIEPGAKYDAHAVGRGRAYEAGFRAGVDAHRAANLTVADEGHVKVLGGTPTGELADMCSCGTSYWPCDTVTDEAVDRG